jgi:hypothetical protein
LASERLLHQIVRRRVIATFAVAYKIAPPFHCNRTVAIRAERPSRRREHPGT